MKFFSILFLTILLFMNSAFSSTIIPNLDFFNNFNDKFLIGYISKALENNHELKQTNHIVEQYRLEIKNSFSKELPQLSVGANYLGTHFPNGDMNIFLNKNSFILPFQASYEPDFLLKNRDKTKSTKKLYQAELAKQKNVYISLLSDVASGYINILLYDNLIKKQLEILNNDNKNLTKIEKKFLLGVISSTDLNDAKKENTTQKTIYDNLIKNRKTIINNFCLLIGESANNSKDIQRGKLDNFEYLKTIPETIDSNIIYNRPDLIEIENRLKSAKIDITVAKKDFFPSFKLNGFLAFDTAGRGNFFAWESSFAFLIAGLTQDIFTGGRKITNLKIKKARFEELMETYKQRDLNAIKEINNALNIIKYDRITENNAKYQVFLEEKNCKNSNKKLNRGTISEIDFLKSKNTLNQKQQLLASAKASRLINYITLYKALGGQLWKKIYW